MPIQLIALTMVLELCGLMCINETEHTLFAEVL